MDAMASDAFFHMTCGKSPCITKARGGQQGFYLMKSGRFMSLYEMAGLQGWRKDWVEVMLQANDSVTEMGKAIGDGMSLNILQRVLPRALYSVNILQELPLDIWAEPTPSGSLPSAAYARIPKFKKKKKKVA